MVGVIVRRKEVGSLEKIFEQEVAGEEEAFKIDRGEVSWYSMWAQASG